MTMSEPQFSVTMNFNRIELDAWIDKTRQPDGSYRLVGMGRCTEYDANTGAVVSEKVETTGLTGTAPHDAFVNQKEVNNMDNVKQNLNKFLKVGEVNNMYKANQDLNKFPTVGNCPMTVSQEIYEFTVMLLEKTNKLVEFAQGKLHVISLASIKDKEVANPKPMKPYPMYFEELRGKLLIIEDNLNTIEDIINGVEF